MGRALTILVVMCTTIGCAQRSSPYRFRSPVLSGVSAAELPPPGDEATPDEAVPEPAPASPPRVAATRSRPTVHVPPADAPAPEQPAVTTGDLGSPLADTLRSMVGLREAEATPLSFAITALSTIGADLDEAARDLADGEALVALAEARGATATEGTPLLGDLVVFDGVVDRKPASAVAVVVSVDRAGTVELIYLARGVIRRGYMNLSHPRKKRDANDAVLNTIIRQKDGNGRKGRGDLTADRFRAFIHLDALAPR